MSGFRWLAVAGFVLLSSGCVADGRVGGSLITTGRHEVEAGIVVDGHLVLLGGRFHVPDGASITGSAFVIGGDLRLLGRLDGDLTMLGGSAELGPRASVGGDLRLAGGDLALDPAAEVAGRVVSGVDAEAALGLVRAEDPSLAEQLIRFTIQLAGLLVLAALAARWLPGPTGRIGDALRRRALLSSAIGLLAVLVGLPLVVFMAFTVVLIPLALILALGYGIVLAVAWVSLGRQIGRQVEGRTNRLCSSMAQALVGTLLLTVAAGVLGLVPVIGDVAIIATLVTCIGAAVLTRLGTVAAPAPAA